MTLQISTLAANAVYKARMRANHFWLVLYQSFQAFEANASTGGEAERRRRANLNAQCVKQMSHYFLAAGAEGARTDSSCCFNCW
jgi:hypothetical protein